MREEKGRKTAGVNGGEGQGFVERLKEASPWLVTGKCGGINLGYEDATVGARVQLTMGMIRNSAPTQRFRWLAVLVSITCRDDGRDVGGRASPRSAAFSASTTSFSVISLYLNQLQVYSSPGATHRLAVCS